MKYFLLLTSMICSFFLSAQTAQGHINEGNAKFNLKDYEGAIAEYTLAISADYKAANAYYYRGRAKNGMKDYYGAIEDCGYALKIKPQYDSAYNSRGYAKQSLKDYTGAILDFNKAIELNPKIVMSYTNRGFSKAELHNYQDALSDLNMAIQLEPNSVLAYYYRALVNKELKNYQATIDDFNKTIELSPNSEEAYYYRGWAKHCLKDYQGAIDDYTHVINIKPSLSQPYLNRGEAKLAMKQKEGGCADLSKAVELGNTKAAEEIKQYCQNGNTVAKVWYKDGKTFQYYTNDGISVTMTLQTEREYGTYYVASIMIENFTGSAFNFNPEDIKAIVTVNGMPYETKIYSNDEYIKKVRRKQGASAFFYAWGQNLAASGAGYSRSTTSSTTTGQYNTNFSAAGYYGNNYGYVIGSVNTTGASTTQSTTRSYDGAAAYAAQQNADNNVSELKNQQYQVRNQLDQGYLKLNTISNEERITGQVNIQYKRGDNLKIIVPVNGENYEFNWKAGK